MEPLDRQTKLSCSLGARSSVGAEDEGTVVVLCFDDGQGLAAVSRSF